MDKINELRRSVLRVHNLIKRRPTIVQIPIFATDRCNSKCLICNIWKKKLKTDLEPDVVGRILSSRVLSKSASFVLTGGEFILHPEYEEILSLMNKSGKEYGLLSNGLLSERLITVVREFGVKSVSLSLDGPPETYRKIRGVDGYSHVKKVVEELKDDNVRVNIDYTINPWNSRGDLLHVMDFCKKNAVNLHVGYYCNVECYDVKHAGDLYRVEDLIDRPYHRLYPAWASGNLRMPCLSILARPVIRPNGDIHLCEPRQIKLGNLYKQDLEAIWQSNRTTMLQKSNFSCNGCWHDAQRECDIHAIQSFKYLVPTVVLNTIFGRSDWRKIYRFLK